VRTASGRCRPLAGRPRSRNHPGRDLSAAAVVVCYLWAHEVRNLELDEGGRAPTAHSSRNRNRLRRFQDAIGAGIDPDALVDAINEAQAQRAAAQAELDGALRRPRSPTPRSTR
jgi:hypothetical protein